MDLWDMKPDAPAEIRGPFRPIDTIAPGIKLSEALPLHAKIADKFSLVRSVHHDGAAIHDVGWQIMQTGRRLTGGEISPHIGSVVGYLHGSKTDLPLFAVLPGLMKEGGGNMPNGQAAGFLGESNNPFVPDTESSNPEIDTSTVEADGILTARTSLTAFDLSREPQAVRERYGRTRFGQCCLMARRLVENDFRFVTINTFLTVFDEISWDIHGARPFTTIEGMRDFVCPMYDRAYSALIGDLDDRGLLSTTLVCNLAEFGRTPRINPAGGRDHWPQCFTVGFAGGGIQGGRVVGASDSIGAFPADRPVEPAEIAATIFHCLGLDLKTTLPGPGGQQFPLVDPGYREIEELF